MKKIATPHTAFFRLFFLCLLLTASTIQLWAADKTLISGTRVYFDCTNWTSDGARFKINLYGTDGNFAKAVEATAHLGNIYYIDLDGSYNGFQVIRMSSDYGSQWNYTQTKWGDQRGADDQYMLTLGSCYDNANPSWGYGPFTMTSGKTFYFNNSITQWATPHLRIGRTNYCTATAMTLVPGTKYLYSCSTSSWSGYEAVCVADKASYTGANSIYGKGGGDYLVTGSTTHYKESISTHMYANATAADNTDDGVTYYTTSFTTAAPSNFSVQTSTTKCSVSMVKYTSDPDAVSPTTTNLSKGGTVMPTQYIKVTTTPATGYEFSEVSVSNSGTKTEATASVDGVYWINANCTVSAVCTPKEYTISLDHQDATNTPAPNNIVVTFDASTNLTGVIISTLPTKTGYTFGGYYTEEGGEGTQLISATGRAVTASGEGAYINTSTKWKHDGDVQLYAKWTQTVTLHDNNGGSNNGSVAGVIYNKADSYEPTAPTKIGYKIASGDGYYAEEGCTNKVMTTAGALVNCTDFVSGGKWVHANATTLYAKWTAKSCTVTFDKNSGSSGSDGTTATYDAAMTSVTPPTRDGYTFDGYWDSETDNDGDGTQYYNADGTSAKNWDKDTESETTLYAKWLPIYSVTWSVNGEEWTSGSPTTRVTSGLKVSTFPTAPTTIDCDDYKKFMGWRATPIDGVSVSAPGGIFTDVAGSPAITQDTIFYAVFADQTSPNAGTVLWSESWAESGKPESITANGSVYGSASITYSWQNGDGANTQLNTSTPLAGGEKPEVLVGGKGSGSTLGFLQVTGIPRAGASAVTLEYKQNANRLNVYITENKDTRIIANANTSGSKSVDITCSSVETFILKFEAGTGSNVRLDDISVKVKTVSYANYVTTCAECTEAPSFANTPTITDVDCESATITAEDGLSSLGAGDGCHIRNYGFVWGTNSTPTIDTHTGGDVYTVNKNIDEDVSFSYTITDLTATTHYYVRAYAQNKHGIAYSEVQNLYTTGVSSIAVTTAPTKTWYWAGTSFKSSGIVVTATHADGSTEDVTADCTFSPDEETALTTDDESVTITYTDECGTEHEAEQTIAVYAPSVSEGENDGQGTFAYNSTGLINVNPSSSWTCDLNVTSGNAEIKANGDGTYSIVNPSGPSGTITVVINYRKAANKTVTYKVDGITISTETVKESAKANPPTGSTLLTQMGEAGVCVPSETYGNLVGWVTESFYSQTEVPEFVYNHPTITADITLHAVFSNCKRLRVDNSEITGSGSYGSGTLFSDALTYQYLKKGTVAELGFLRFKKNASEYGLLYNSTSLSNIIRIEVGASGQTDDVPVYAGSAANTISGDALVDANTHPYKYIYNFPESTSYFIVKGDNSNIYVVDYIDVYYNLSGNTERYICQTRKPITSGNWNVAANWSGSAVPSEDEVVHITKPMTVNTSDAVAEEIIILTNEPNTGKLTIGANQALVVEGKIRAWNGTEFGSTAPADLVIKSTEDGNGTLIFKNDGDSATVEMYSKASAASKPWSWQYIAVPFTSTNPLSSYYGSYMYEWPSDCSTWQPVTRNTTLTAFTGYLISNPSANYTYSMEGELAPTEDDVVINVPAGKEMVVGNSWTGPIQITQMTTEDFSKVTATIYLFNTGMDSEEQGAATPDAGDRYAPGTYVTIPINEAEDVGVTKISSLQGFYVEQNNTEYAGQDGSLTLSYSKHVRPTGANTVDNGPMHAPKRVNAEERPTLLKIKVSGSRYDDRLILLEREDFSTGFDNGWDGKKLDEQGAQPMLYTTRPDGTPDAVSALPELDGTVISFRKGEDSNYTLRFEYAENNDELYIFDTKTQQTTRVLSGNTYTFTADDTEAHARFLLTRNNAPQITTGNANANANAEKTTKLILDQKLYIYRNGILYDATGRRVDSFSVGSGFDANTNANANAEQEKGGAE